MIKAFQEMEGYTLMLHEFLTLLCNSTDRLNKITDNHTVDHKQNLHAINQWEISDSTEQRVSHIHLLAPDAFINHAPHHLVQDALQKMTQDKQIKYLGSKINLN